MNHFSRKNIGYLYAIHHGAQQIYDTDDDNELVGDGSGFVQWSDKMMMLKDEDSEKKQIFEWRETSRLFNPYSEFKLSLEGSGIQQFGWPRGFPLAFIQDSRTVFEQKTNNNEDGERIEIEPSRIGVAC